VQINTNGAFAADAGLTYNNGTAGYEQLRVGSASARFLTLSGRVATGSAGSAIQPNSALDIESVNAGNITIGDASGNYDGTMVVVGQTDISFLGASTVNIDCPSITLTQGSLALGASAIIVASTADAKAIKSTIPAGTGVTPTIQVICPSAAFALQNVATTQAVFNTPVDTISLQAATTYMFEGQYLLQTGATSHTTTISFVSSIAITAPSITYTTIASAHSSANAASNSQQTSFFISIGGGIVSNASTAPNTIISFKGIIRTTDAGNLVPHILFSAAPGVGANFTLIGSYIKFYPIGDNTIASVGTAIG